MGMLIEGCWSTENYKSDERGRFLRDETKFHGRVEPGGQHPPEAGRYHLYVSYACPWAHRTLLVRKLRGLEDAISFTAVHPHMGEDGWAFEEPDPVNGARFLRDVYVKARPDYTGRVTVPVLWDRRTGSIVNNESRQVIRMFDTGFADLGDRSVNFYPDDLAEEIDRTIDALYDPINNGVYRAGFATRQEAYEEAIERLFAALDHWEDVLRDRRYLCGDRVTEADWCMFTTLFRFDPVYSIHFKCSRKRLVDYPRLSEYMRDLYRLPGVAETCRMDHIKEHYYTSHPFLNPRGLVPVGPDVDFRTRAPEA